MMANLFASFDPTTGTFLSLNWLSTLLGLMIIPYLYWTLPSRSTMLWSSIMLQLHKEFKVLLPSMTVIFVSLFIFIVLNNFLGLMPYVFTSTSHGVMTLALALPLWMSFMIFGWINRTNHMFAHLVPAGTPIGLIPLMVLIETVSNLIRPGTLAIRLAANMTAGHLLLTLLGNTSPEKLLLFILILSQILLLMLEFAVAIIQSYVFSALSILYASEVN